MRRPRTARLAALASLGALLTCQAADLPGDSLYQLHAAQGPQLGLPQMISSLSLIHI